MQGEICEDIWDCSWAPEEPPGERLRELLDSAATSCKPLLEFQVRDCLSSVYRRGC